MLPIDLDLTKNKTYTLYYNPQNSTLSGLSYLPASLHVTCSWFTMIEPTWIYFLKLEHTEIFLSIGLFCLLLSIWNVLPPALSMSDSSSALRNQFKWNLFKENVPD